MCCEVDLVHTEQGELFSFFPVLMLSYADQLLGAAQGCQVCGFPAELGYFLDAAMVRLFFCRGVG